MSEVTPKSLIVDLLSASPEHRIPVGGLVQVAAVFDIGESSLRVALSRLCAAGTVEPVSRGEYTLSEGAAPLQRRVSSWRSTTRDRVRWAGGWLAVHGAFKGRSKAIATERRALRMLGFEKLGAELHVRPDNLRGGAGAARGRLRELGLGAARMVARMSDLDPSDDERLGGLWQPDRLSAAHRATRESLASSAAALLTRPLAAAVRESFFLGGEAIRQIVMDPLLPTELADPAPLEALIAEMDAYDRLGRGLWAEFFGDPAVRAPALGGGLPAETMGAAP